MKTKVVALGCALALGLSSAPTASAMEDKSPEAIVADVIVVRPACLVATAMGSALFVVCLPFAVVSGSVKATARSLVAKPARATFIRDLGDLSELED